MSDNSFFWLIGVIYWLFFWPLLGNVICERRGRSFEGAFLGFVLGPLGILIAIKLSDKSRKCRECLGSIPDDARRCGHCGAVLERHNFKEIVRAAQPSLDVPLHPIPMSEPKPAAPNENPVGEYAAWRESKGYE